MYPKKMVSKGIQECGTQGLLILKLLNTKKHDALLMMKEISTV